MLRRTVDLIVLLHPARQQTGVAVDGLVAVAEHRLDARDHRDKLSGVGPNFIRTAKPPSRDLVDSLRVAGYSRRECIAVTTLERSEEPVQCRLQFAHVLPLRRVRLIGAAADALYRPTPHGTSKPQAS